MNHTSLKCSVDFPDKGIARLVPAGTINLQTIPQSPLFSAAQQAVSGPAFVVIFDFNEARINDGFGLAHVVALTIKLKKKGLVVAACNLGPHSSELLKELGFNHLFSFYPNLEKALSELKVVGSEKRQSTMSPQDESKTSELLPTDLWPTKMGPTLYTGDLQEPHPLNLISRKVQGPGAGFGSLWQKTYKVRLVSQDLSIAEVFTKLKGKLPDYWPAGNRIALPDGLQTGAPGIIDLTLPGGLPLSTGIRVLNLSEEAFSFVPIQGHMEAGWISFGVCEENGYPCVVVQSLARTGDLFYELGFDIFGHRQQEDFWDQTLSAMALDFGEKALVEVSASCLDNTKNWSGWNNLWWNAGLRTTICKSGRRLQQLMQRQANKTE